MEGFDPEEFAQMKETYRTKTKQVDEKEFELKKIDGIVASSINCVSRLIFQLYSDFEKEEISKANREGAAQGVTPSNVEA
jgi:hypothetical protein